MIHLDTGYAERAGEPLAAAGFEQRVGLQGTLSHGWTVVAALGFGQGEDGGLDSTQEGEVLRDLLSGGMRLAAGLGLQRGWDGVFAAVGRVVFGRNFEKSILFTNLRFERPFSRDLFSLDITGSTYVPIHTFGSTATEGSNPYAGLLLASDGFLYGTTEKGNNGAGLGTVFA